MPPSAPKLRPFAAMAWMLLASALFAVMNLAAKRAMSALPWHEVAAGRAVFGALTVYGFARARGVSLVIHDRKTQWARSLCGFGALSAGFYALAHMPMGDSVTLGQLSPLFIAIASARALGERSSGSLFFAIAFGISGVALVAGAHMNAGISFFPFAIAILAALFSCAAMIFLRRLGPKENAEAVSLHFVAVSGAGTLLLGLGHHVVPSARDLTSLVVAGLAGGFAQISMTRAYGLDKAARVGAVGYSGVVMSMILGVVFLDEIPTWKQALGGALVIASGAVLVASALREEKKTRAPSAEDARVAA